MFQLENKIKKQFPRRQSLPFEPPIKRNVINERITPNTSVVSSVYTLPVFGSGRSNSKLLPRDTRISCDLVPEKLPCAACVMPVECCSVKLYKYMLIFCSLLLFSVSTVQNKCTCVTRRSVDTEIALKNTGGLFMCCKCQIYRFFSLSTLPEYLFANHHTLQKFQLMAKFVPKFNELRIFVANEYFFFFVTSALNL